MSRWGRFQDVDESAYYEFICKEAGIQVRYCAELFENDGSLASAILKNIKRAMAGEYSRELSTKVFVGQCHGAELGFWQGGPAGYGLRRQIIDERGVPRTQLERGQQKSLQTDRVILIPGPATEVKTIKRIFRSFVVERKSRTDIAKALNVDGIATSSGKSWNCHLIHKLLTSEKYIGHNVYNHASFKLGRKYVTNPPDMWVRCNDAFKAIIRPELFAKAQAMIARQQRRPSNQRMLGRLKALWRRKGRLTEKLIRASKSTPDASTFIAHFRFPAGRLSADRIRAPSKIPTCRDHTQAPRRPRVGRQGYCFERRKTRRHRGGTPQDNQLMSKHRVLSLKPHLRLEWRGQGGQDETEKPDHFVSLGDSIASSTDRVFGEHKARA